MQTTKRSGKSSPGPHCRGEPAGPERSITAAANVDPVAAGKNNVCFNHFPGYFLKKCPGTGGGYLCCNYYVLNIQTNCNFDCQYCILQDYINNNRLSICTNLGDALNEVTTFLQANPGKLIRIGTGELTDSLSLDHITKHSSVLIPFFMKQKNALLELKTKSDNINNLVHRQLRPRKNIVVSWSLNPPFIINTCEHGGVSLVRRLEAARKCRDAGYAIGIHLDPVILYQEWEKDYRNLIASIFRYINPQDIIWLSIAGFRYTSRLKNIIRERWPQTRLFLGEMIKCPDHKYRYIRPVRTEAYRKLVKWIRDFGPAIPIYFCMENPAVWRDVFGKLPSEIDNLSHVFTRPGKHIGA